jgi:YVTN family beta-propeller protein
MKSFGSSTARASELSRIAFTGGGRRASLARPTGVTSSCPSAGSARVAVIDATTRAVVAHIPAGDTPDGVAYTTRRY